MKDTGWSRLKQWNGYQLRLEGDGSAFIDDGYFGIDFDSMDAFIKYLETSTGERETYLRENEKIKKYANRIGYSDVDPCEVIKRKSKKSLIIRAMDAELDKTWKPDTVVGGFSGHTVNNHSQEWIITSNEKHRTFIIRKHKDGQWYSKDGQKFRLSDTPCKFYDYNF